MAMGKRKRKLRQQSIWIATQELPRSASHPFYKRLNRILEQNGFDEYVEQRCESFYAPTMGRPSLAPGMYFGLLMLGYFEGIDSERGIAWRAADSLSVREFVGLELGEAPPDHSTISRTRRLIEVETHRAVFSWILDRLAAAGWVKGETLGVDATMLEANAALGSIVRRDTGEGYEAFLTRLAKASGIATPTREDLARLDRKRPKKGSNDDWTHPQDPDARITKMKDGRTHLAHKAEPAVDLETGAVVAVTVQPADKGDPETVKETLTEAAENVEKAKPQTDVVKELVTDKGYLSNRSWRILPSWVFALTYPSRPVAAGIGKESMPRATLSTVIDDGLVEREADGCSASGVSAWSAPSHMPTKLEDCAGSICAATPTSSNVC